MTSKQKKKIVNEIVSLEQKISKGIDAETSEKRINEISTMLLALGGFELLLEIDELVLKGLEKI